MMQFCMYRPSCQISRTLKTPCVSNKARYSCDNWEVTSYGHCKVSRLTEITVLILFPSIDEPESLRSSQPKAVRRVVLYPNIYYFRRNVLPTSDKSANIWLLIMLVLNSRYFCCFGFQYLTLQRRVYVYIQYIDITGRMIINDALVVCKQSSLTEQTIALSFCNHVIS